MTRRRAGSRCVLATGRRRSLALMRGRHQRHAGRRRRRASSRHSRRRRRSPRTRTTWSRAALLLTFTFTRRAAAAVDGLVRSHARRATTVAASVKFDTLTGVYQVVEAAGRPRRSGPSARTRTTEVRDWMTTFDQRAARAERAARAQRRVLRARAAAARARSRTFSLWPFGRDDGSGRTDFTFIR